MSVLAHFSLLPYKLSGLCAVWFLQTDETGKKGIKDHHKSERASKMMDNKTSADHLLVELCHHLLKRNIPGFICFTEFLQDLQEK